MKYCDYCGKNFPDEMDVCPTDGKPLQRPGEVPRADSPRRDVEVHQASSPAEQRFWSQMTFKDFAALLLRFQALWFFFYALLDATYLTRFVNLSSSASSYSTLSASAKLDLFMLILRVGLNAALGLVLIKHAERVLGWLVRDWMLNQPPKSDEQAK